MVLCRPCAVLTVSLLLLAFAPAVAQPSGAALLRSLDPDSFAVPYARPGTPDFRMPEGDLRMVGEPRRNGLIAAFPVRENLEIGIGRFNVPEMARPRTHMEPDRQPVSVRSRERGIAAVGFSVRF